MPDATTKRMSRTERRLALLDAATRVLLARETTFTFESIAAEANVSPTLPYKYFESIEEVAHELYRRVVSPVDEETNRLLADAGRTFDDKVRSSLELWCETIVRDGPLLLRLADGGAHTSLTRVIDERRERAVTAWADAVERQFDVEGDAARILAASLTAGSAAALRRWTQDRVDRSRVIDVFVTLASAQVEAVAAGAG